MLDEEAAHWSAVGIYNNHSYWVVKCRNTIIELHTMHWIWVHHRHPREDM
jgi:hypothetical protein